MADPIDLDFSKMDVLNGVPFPDISRLDQGKVNISMSSDLTLLMEDDPKNNTKFVWSYNQGQQEELFIAIEQDSVIQLSLDPTKRWEFDKSKAILDFKNGPDKKYYAVQFDPHEGTYIHN